MRASESQPAWQIFRRHPLVLYSYLVFFIIVIILSFLLFQHFLVIFAVSASVAILLSHVNNRLIRVLRGRRGLAAAILVALAGVLILAPLLSYGALIANQARAFFSAVAPHFQREALQRLLADTLPARLPFLKAYKDLLRLDDASVSDLISKALTRLASGANYFVQTAATRLASVLIYSTLFLIILFFLLRDGAALGSYIRSVSPLTRDQEDSIYEHLSKTVKGVLYTMVVVPVVQGILAMIGFSVFGLPAPLFWGAMLIFAAVIPAAGSVLVWFPASAYVFFAESAWRGIGLFLYGALIISTSDNIIKPLLLRHTARIHTLLAFLSLLGGILSFGVVGFVVGPVILSLMISAVRIYRLDIMEEPGALEEKPSEADGEGEVCNQTDSP